MVRKIVLASLLATAVACGDSTGPEDFDPVDTQTKADAVLSAFDDNPALLSMGALANFNFGGPLLHSTIPFAPAEGAVPGPATAARLRSLARAVPSFGSAGPMAIFPADLLGATFVWDEVEAHYVRDTQRTGAPEDGVRIILYAVDPVLHLPVSPLNEVGHLDIIDESTPQADALHLIAVVNDITHLDYVASAVTTQTSVTLNAEGYLSDGTDQVDFALSLGVAQVGETTVETTLDYLLTHEQGSIRLEGSSSSDDTGDITLTITDGDNTIILDISFLGSALSGTIEYNGEVVVEISGTEQQPVFTRTDGTPLTNEELASLRHLGLLVEVIFEHFSGLLAPAALAFALG